MADQPVPCRYIDRAGRRNELDGAAEPTDPNVSDLDRAEEGNSAPMKHKAEVIGTSAKSAQTASADPTTITCHAMESASVALSRPETFGERLHWADRRRRRDPRSGVQRRRRCTRTGRGVEATIAGTSPRHVDAPVKLPRT